MKTILLFLLLAIPCFAQEVPKSPDDVKPEPPKCVHVDDDDFYASLEHSPPMRLLMIDGQRVTFSRTTKYGIKYLELSMVLKDIKMPPTVWKIDEKKRWFVLYCRRDKVAWVIEELQQKK